MDKPSGRNFKRIALGKYYSRFHCSVTPDNYERVAIRFADLKQLTEYSICLSMVFDLHKGEFIFYYNRLRSLFADELTRQNIQNGSSFIDFLSQESVDEMSLHYNSAFAQLTDRESDRITEFRQQLMVSSFPQNKHRLEFVHSVQIYDTDREGKPWLLLLMFHPYIRKGNEPKYPPLIIDSKNRQIFSSEACCVLSNHLCDIVYLDLLGLSAKEIGDALYLSPKTVNTLRQLVKASTDSKSLTHAIRKVILMGII